MSGQLPRAAMVLSSPRVRQRPDASSSSTVRQAPSKPRVISAMSAALPAITTQCSRRRPALVSYGTNALAPRRSHRLSCRISRSIIICGAGARTAKRSRGRDRPPYRYRTLPRRRRVGRVHASRHDRSGALCHPCRPKAATAPGTTRAACRYDDRCNLHVPSLPLNAATICPRIETAISPGARPPMSSPTGA